MENNLALWDRHKKPHDDALRKFKKGGGFSGTAIDPMWVIREATSEWGPVGYGWGYSVIKEEYVTGAQFKDGDGNDVLHVLRVEIWYTGDNGERCVLESYGQTMFVGQNKNGPFTDEEAPKKSLTDAVSKGLSWLGFGSAVHMGMFDGNKYVDLRGDSEQPQPKSNPAPKEAPEEPKKDKNYVFNRAVHYLELLEELVGGSTAQDVKNEVMARWSFSRDCKDLSVAFKRGTVTECWNLKNAIKAEVQRIAKEGKKEEE